jgi:hypothetical protein
LKGKNVHFLKLYFLVLGLLSELGRYRPEWVEYYDYEFLGSGANKPAAPSGSRVVTVTVQSGAVMQTARVTVNIGG